jgi:hypothetical protein
MAGVRGSAMSEVRGSTMARWGQRHGRVRGSAMAGWVRGSTGSARTHAKLRPTAMRRGSAQAHALDAHARRRHRSTRSDAHSIRPVGGVRMQAPPTVSRCVVRPRCYTRTRAYTRARAAHTRTHHAPTHHTEILLSAEESSVQHRLLCVRVRPPTAKSLPMLQCECPAATHAGAENDAPSVNARHPV